MERSEERCHNGQVITLKSDLRWCSDGFEIWCWNKEVVRVAFSLDCCDRELMHYVATTGGITAEKVQDLLLESLEYRLCSSERVPHPLEWLADNGSCYIAREECVRGFTGVYRLHHAGEKSTEQWYGRGIRKNVQAGLCISQRFTECGYCPGEAAR